MLENEQVLHNYREALRKLSGDNMADSSNLYYAHGWYYISLARRCPDGSYYTPSIANGKRKDQIIRMTTSLLARAEEKK